MANESFSGKTFFGETFSPGLRLKDCVIENAVFADCYFNHTMWQNVILKNSQFHNCRFSKNTWQGGEVIGCTLVGCDFSKHSWNDVNIGQTLIDSAKFNDSSWSGALDQVRLLRSTWPTMNLSWATVESCQFYQMPCLDKAFPWEVMRNTVFDDCDMGELSLSQKKLGQLTFSRCRFKLLDLTATVLANIDFIESQMEKVIASKLQSEYLQMGRTLITEGNFDAMVLTGASIFTEANLTNVSFKQAKMGVAVFEKAAITGCTFEAAEFLGCNLADAHLERVSFKDSKLANLYLSDTITANVEGL